MYKINDVLIDGDAVAYMSGFSVQNYHYKVTHLDKEYDFGKVSKEECIKLFKQRTKNKINIKNCKVVKYAVPKSEDSRQHACYSAFKMMQDITHKLPINMSDTVRYRVYLTSMDKSNFRYDLATIRPYKGNRDDSGRPIFLDDIRDYLIMTYNAEVIFGMEADDKLSIEHHKNINNSIIVTHDKDLKTTAKLIYDIKKNQLIKLNKQDNLWWFYYQILFGDSGDNIPGLKTWMAPRKFGDVGVRRVLRELEENTFATEIDFFNVVKRAYMHYCNTQDDAYMFEERILEIGNLLYMRRTDNDKWEIPK